MKVNTCLLLVGLFVCNAIMIVYLMSEDRPTEKEQVVNAIKSGAGQVITTPEKILLTPEQRAARIAELRKAAADTELKMSAQEAQEAFFEYVLLQCVGLFEGLADALSEGVTKVSGDVKAGEAVKRLPAAFADGMYLTFHLIKTMANKEYLENLKSLRIALNCLVKPSQRLTGSCSVIREVIDTEGNTKFVTIPYDTLNKALSGVFTFAPKVLLPVAQATVLGIDVGDRKVKGLVPLGIAVIDPNAQAIQHIDVVTQVINLMLVFSEQIQHMEQDIHMESSYAHASGSSNSIGLQSTTESPTTQLSSAQEAEFKKLAERNARAQQIFKDLQVFAALSHEITKLFPNDRSINGVVIPLRDMAQAAIACLYNITELGFGIINIVDKKAQPMSLAASCLKYTNAELKAASSEGKLVDNYIAQCAASGCKNKKECVAKMLIMVVDCIKIIFDTVLVKYDPKTQTSQRGLLMNIDVIIDKFTNILLSTKSVKDGLNKLHSKGFAQAEDFLKKINSLRTLIKFFGQALSGIMEAFIFAAAQIDLSGVPPEVKEEYKEVFDQIPYNNEIPEEDLDSIYGEFSYNEEA